MSLLQSGAIVYLFIDLVDGVLFCLVTWYQQVVLFKSVVAVTGYFVSSPPLLLSGGTLVKTLGKLRCVLGW